MRLNDMLRLFFTSFIRRVLLCSHRSLLLLLLFFEHLKYFDLCVDLKRADHRFHHHHQFFLNPCLGGLQRCFRALLITLPYVMCTVEMCCVGAYEAEFVD